MNKPVTLTLTVRTLLCPGRRNSQTLEIDIFYVQHISQFLHHQTKEKNILNKSILRILNYLSLSLMVDKYFRCFSTVS